MDRFEGVMPCLLGCGVSGGDGGDSGVSGGDGGDSGVSGGDSGVSGDGGGIVVLVVLQRAV